MSDTNVIEYTETDSPSPTSIAAVPVRQQYQKMSRQQATSALETRLLQLIDEHGGRIATSLVPDMYPQRQFQLDLANLGPGKNLKNVTGMIPTIQRVQLPKNEGSKTNLKWYLTRNSRGKSPPIATHSAQIISNGTGTSGSHAKSNSTAVATRTNAGVVSPLKDVVLIESMAQLKALAETNPIFHDEWKSAATAAPTPWDNDNDYTDDVIVAIDFEGSLCGSTGISSNVDPDSSTDSLYLIQLATATTIYVLDCLALGELFVGRVLTPLLQNKHIVKLVHQGHDLGSVLSSCGGVASSYAGWLDTELAVEALAIDRQSSSPQLCTDLDDVSHCLMASRGHAHSNSSNAPWRNSNSSNTRAGTARGRGHGALCAQRPLSKDALSAAVQRVRLLRGVLWEQLYATLHDDLDLWTAVQSASDARVQYAATAAASPRTIAESKRQICFDVARSYTVASLELLQQVRPHDILHSEPLVVSNETGTLLAMLPDDLAQDLESVTEHLSDIVLDKGRAPHAWVGGERHWLGGPGRLVDATEIGDIVFALGGFGTDNRAGLAKQLHRISAVRNRETEIIGLTMRVGRHVSGNATMIADLLFAESPESILFLGEPGSGTWSASQKNGQQSIVYR
jgi:hypothetical protein